MNQSKPLLYLIPPLGHFSFFYEELEKTLSPYLNIKLLDYPSPQIFPGTQNKSPFDSKEEILGDLANYFLELIPEKSFLIGGVSLGATVSLKMASISKRVHKLLMMAPGGLRVPTLRSNLIKKQLSPLAPLEANLVLSGLNHQKVFLKHFQLNSELAQAYFIKASSKHLELSHSIDYRCFLSGSLNANYEGEYKAHKEKIILLWGETDRVFGERHLSQFTSLLGKQSLHILPGVGHFFPLESPKQVAEVLFSHGQLYV